MHHYRLNGLFGSQWREIGRGTFETPNCMFVNDIACQLDAAATNRVHFAIPPASPVPGFTPGEQWIDLTLSANPRNSDVDNGFPPDTFVGAGPFSPGGGAFYWYGIVPGRRHHYRQNTLYAAGSVAEWVTQFSGSFASLDCRGLPTIQLPLG